jgi:hypothetical protein
MAAFGVEQPPRRNCGRAGPQRRRAAPQPGRASRLRDRAFQKPQTLSPRLWPSHPYCSNPVPWDTSAERRGSLPSARRRLLQPSRITSVANNTLRREWAACGSSSSQPTATGAPAARGRSACINGPHGAATAAELRDCLLRVVRPSQLLDAVLRAALMAASAKGSATGSDAAC